MRLGQKSAIRTAVLVGALVAAAGFPVAAVQAGARPAGRPAVAAVPVAGPQAVALRGRVIRPASAQASADSGILSGVYCTSGSRCWAVGERFTAAGAAVNHILRWNGTAWRTVSAPNPGGTKSGDLNDLFAVRCLTGGNCWAVGEYAKGGGLLGEALHWNGTKWSSTAVPATGGHHKFDATELFDVTCTSPSSCWSAGDVGKFSGTVSDPNPVRLRNLMLHWNGSKWSRVGTPDPAGTSTGRVNEIFGVRCLSGSNCNAVGFYGTAGSSPVLRNLALHWNGTKWSQSHTPNPGGTAAGHVSELSGEGCISGGCWAAGVYGTQSGLAITTGHDEILRWNGKHWRRAAAPNPLGGELIGLVCESARNCWAVGNQGTMGTGIVNQAVHWNGTKWHLVTTPNPAGSASGDFSTLIGVRCTSKTNCWAVGASIPSGGKILEEILRWNGTKWKVWS
jgi:hypothetical protein